jgi:hypothetical protein
MVIATHPENVPWFRAVDVFPPAEFYVLLVKPLDESHESPISARGSPPGSSAIRGDTAIGMTSCAFLLCGFAALFSDHLASYVVLPSHTKSSWQIDRRRLRIDAVHHKKYTRVRPQGIEPCSKQDISLSPTTSEMVRLVFPSAGVLKVISPVHEQPPAYPTAYTTVEVITHVGAVWIEHTATTVSEWQHQPGELTPMP